MQGFSIPKGVDKTYVRNYFLVIPNFKTNLKLFKNQFEQKLKIMGCSDSKYGE